LYFDFNGLIVVGYDFTVTTSSWTTGFTLPNSIKAATVGILAYFGCQVTSVYNSVMSGLVSTNKRKIYFQSNAGYGTVVVGGQYRGWLMYY